MERKRNRLLGYDYSKDNLYFITSCVQNRICCLGEIREKKMILNNFGEIVLDQWHWLQIQYPYVMLHEFVVMPNHIHGIIEINRSMAVVDSVGTGRGSIVGTGRDPSLQWNEPIKIKSLSELMGAFKTTTSKKIHLTGNKYFAWQRSFHDHIIRDKKSYVNISEYIKNNPSSWDNDEFYN